MAFYTSSYYIKGAEKFDPDAKIFQVANGWVKVVQTFEADDNESAIKYAVNIRYPLDSWLQKIELVKDE